MAHQGYKVMDSDMHLIEPHDLWQRYIDPAYQAIAPILEDVPDGSFVLKRSGGPDVEPTRIALPDR